MGEKCVRNNISFSLVVNRQLTEIPDKLPAVGSYVSAVHVHNERVIHKMVIMNVGPALSFNAGWSSELSANSVIQNVSTGGVLLYAGEKK